MAVGLIQRMPENFVAQMYDSVNSKLGDELPAGALFHAVGEDESGRWQLIEVWESREAHDRFVEDHLWPAIQEEMKAMGVDPDQAPQPERLWFEVHNSRAAPQAAAH